MVIYNRPMDPMAHFDGEIFLRQCASKSLRRFLVPLGLPLDSQVLWDFPKFSLHIFGFIEGRGITKFESYRRKFRSLTSDNMDS